MFDFNCFSKTKTNKELIFEFDEFLPSWLVKSGELQFKTFGFEYGHHASTLDDGEPFFGKMLYLREDGLNRTGPGIVNNIVDYLTLELLPQIDNRGKFKELQRIAVNGQLPGQNPKAHIDTESSPHLWTLVYYVSGNSGDTVFYQSLKNRQEIHRCKFKKGKAVLFPSPYCHQAEGPDSGWRVSLGVTFEWHTDLNKLLEVDK